MQLHNIWLDKENEDFSYLKENWIFPFHFVLKLVSVNKFMILTICEICLEEKQKKHEEIATNSNKYQSAFEFYYKYLIELNI